MKNTHKNSTHLYQYSTNMLPWLWRRKTTDFQMQQTEFVRSEMAILCQQFTANRPNRGGVYGSIFGVISKSRNNSQSHPWNSDLHGSYTSLKSPLHSMFGIMIGSISMEWVPVATYFLSVYGLQTGVSCADILTSSLASLEAQTFPIIHTVQ
jgi:hypothetical protein